jgi:hypothetical protein
MVEGRGKFEWAQTSALMALIANIVRDPKRGKPMSPATFNPFAPQAKKIILHGEEMKEALKAAFCREKK